MLIPQLLLFQQVWFYYFTLFVALFTDGESLPTLKSLQDAVICKTEEDGEEYLSIVTHLMRYALDDPGVPNPKEVSLIYDNRNI